MESLFESSEAVVRSAVGWVRLIIEAIGAAIIVVGVVSAVLLIFRALLSHQRADFNTIRLTLARYLALALEFQLAADILSTAVAPTWNQIGQLAAIAVIRTGLNYFLMHEMKEERAQGEEEKT